MANHRTILHPTGLSTESHHSFTVACALARQAGCELVLLHVMPQVRDRSYAMRCDRALDALTAAHPNLAVRGMLLVGNAADKIVWAAKEFRHDLIVLGRGRRSAVDWLLGRSVSKRVGERSPCPVLTVNAPRKSFADAVRAQVIAGSASLPLTGTLA